MLEMLLQKLKIARESSSRVVFCYKYVWSRIDDYVSLTNLRLEAIQVRDGKVFHTQAAPVLDVNHGKPRVAFADSGIVQVTSGPRSNIVLRERLLHANETAAPVPFCGTREITESSDEKELQVVYDFLTSAAFPGVDMRMPQLFRITKNPERLRLNITPGLLQALDLDPGTPSKEIQDAFMNRLPSISAQTSEGYVLPFDWVYAGGMIAASITGIGKHKPKVLYTRGMDFFRNWCAAKQWSITCC